MISASETTSDDSGDSDENQPWLFERVFDLVDTLQPLSSALLDSLLTLAESLCDPFLKITPEQAQNLVLKQLEDRRKRIEARESGYEAMLARLRQKISGRGGFHSAPVSIEERLAFMAGLCRYDRMDVLCDDGSIWRPAFIQFNDKKTKMEVVNFETGEQV